MMRAPPCMIVMTVLSGAAFGQAAPPAFDIADVHTAVRRPIQNMSGGVLRGGRYELRQATMVDLIQTAYSVGAEYVVGGPAWLEFDRFDVIAKTAPSTPQETVLLMLQSLLAERFKLEVRKDMRSMPVFVLSMGKGKLKLKETEGAGNTGCQPLPNVQSGPAQYNAISCRNMTMEVLARSLRSLAGGYITSTTIDSTGLKGGWDFDLKWTARGLLAMAGPDGITIFDAVDKQLGLKLEAQKVPLPVIVVDRVNQRPAPNPPGVTTSLPPPPPAEFEVATIKPTPPGAPRGGGGFQPSGRVDFRGIPLRTLITIAWNLPPSEDLPGAPKWLTLQSPVFDVVAKAPATMVLGGTQVNAPLVDLEDLRVMIRALLTDRFKIATHYEDRPVSAYTLVAAKPKLKAADPSNRSGCKLGQTPGNTREPSQIGPPAFQATCLNVTMAQFAEQLQTIASFYFQHPVQDATGITGAWDITLTFSPVPPGMAGGFGADGGGRGGPVPAGARGGEPGSSAGGAPAASDPSGGYTIFDAVNKQLGLKLEMQKRSVPVLIIDHIEEQPTDN